MLYSRQPPGKTSGGSGRGLRGRQGQLEAQAVGREARARHGQQLDRIAASLTACSAAGDGGRNATGEEDDGGAAVPASCSSSPVKAAAILAKKFSERH